MEVLHPLGGDAGTGGGGGCVAVLVPDGGFGFRGDGEVVSDGALADPNGGGDIWCGDALPVDLDPSGCGARRGVRASGSAVRADGDQLRAIGDGSLESSLGVVVGVGRDGDVVGAAVGSLDGSYDSHAISLLARRAGYPQPGSSAAKPSRARCSGTWRRESTGRAPPRVADGVTIQTVK